MDFHAEHVTRGVLVLIQSEIGPALEEANQRMEANDAAYYAAMGVSPVPATPLAVPVQYFANLLPETLKRPLTGFPNVSVLAFRRTSTSSLEDQSETVRYDTAIEAFVADEDIEAVARMAARYASAISGILEGDPTLNGLTRAADTSPEVILSQAVARRENSTQSQVIHLQGCRIETSYEFIEPWRVA